MRGGGDGGITLAGVLIYAGITALLSGATAYGTNKMNESAAEEARQNQIKETEKNRAIETALQRKSVASQKVLDKLKAQRDKKTIKAQKRYLDGLATLKQETAFERRRAYESAKSAIIRNAAGRTREA